jgi:predicted methyltransferase
MRHALATVALLACSLGAQAQFQPEKLTPMGEKIVAAMKSDIRTPEEKDRDAERLPRQTLEFFGLREDMRVIELVPGAGFYTKILGPVLADKGELYEAIGTRQVEPLIKTVPALSKVKLAPTDAKFAPAPNSKLFDLGGPFTLGVTDADMVLTFRKALNEAVFRSLKPGGLYGILDHTRRHMEPDGPENWRRVDPVLAIREVQAAGFQFVDYSDIHYTPDDELRYEVGRKSVTGNTDRFTLLFRKPK